MGQIGPIKIDKGIPIPTTRDAGPVEDCHPRPKWTQLLRGMIKGDSFLVIPETAPAVLASAHRIGVGTLRRRGPNRKLRIPEGKVRIWRTN